MATKRRIISIALLVAILGAFAWYLLRAPPEPVYDGKPISHLLKREVDISGVAGTFLVVPLDGGIIKENLASFRTGGGFGLSDLTLPAGLDSNAVPFLLGALQKHDGVFHELYAKYLPKMPEWLQKRLPLPVDAATIRGNAAGMLSQTGPGSRETIEALIRVVKDDGDWIVRLRAVDSLGRIGVTNKLATQTLTACLNDTNQAIRIVAAESLKLANPAFIPNTNRDKK